MAKMSTDKGRDKPLAPEPAPGKLAALLTVIDDYTAGAAAWMSDAFTHCCAIHASADSPGPNCAWSLDERGRMKVEWTSVRGAARSEAKIRNAPAQPNAP